jgi:hypothetical protein
VPARLTDYQYSDNSGVPLNNFLNSLFDDWPGPFAKPPLPGPLTRAAMLQQIKTAEVNGQPVPEALWLIDQETVDRLVATLAGYWQFALGDGVVRRVIVQDQRVVQRVRDYVQANNMRLLVPQFVCAAQSPTEASAYRFAGYVVEDFRPGGAWSRAVVTHFLTLFLAGAHFVVIHGDNDLGPNHGVADFYASFAQLQGVANASHSHYAMGIGIGSSKIQTVALRGKCHPTLTLDQTVGNNLDKLATPANAVLLPVVLSDYTSDQPSTRNSFFQMEGWPTGKPMYSVSENVPMMGWLPQSVRTPITYDNKPALAGGYRHGADFNTHGKSLWNISTYGACPFSEKRGGACFFAPQAWIDRSPLRLYQGFGGRNSGHGWFHHAKVLSS